MSPPGATPPELERTDQIVLLVDDDPTIRLLVMRYLEGMGLQVHTAANGREGLDVLSRVQPDAVLLDVIMPEMDGFDACRAIRRLSAGKNLPILMMTGLDDVDSIKRAYEAGATDFISKPIENVLLGHRTRYLLRSASVLDSLQASERHLARAQEIARLGHWIWTPRQGALEVSESLAGILGIPAGSRSLRGALREMMHLVEHEDRARLVESLRSAARDHTTWQFKHRIKHPDSSQHTVNHQALFGLPAGAETESVTGIVQDVTEIEQAEDRIRFLAYHDSLTGLPNRESFRANLEQGFDLARRSDRQMAVLFLDVDNFKRINDTLSHRIGDILLEVMAQRLVSELRHCDRVARGNVPRAPSRIARLGGDEFTILLSEVRHAEDAAVVARRLLDAVSKPVRIEKHEICVTASIGIAVFPGDGEDVDRLLMNADTAMYSAKLEGKNTARFYTSAMNIRALERLSMEMNLRKAMELKQLSLAFQPLVDLGNGRVRAFEALLRWDHPELGSIPPQDFIPLAESSGLIVTLGEWVMNQVCGQQKKWQELGFGLLPIAVNVSSVQFRQPNFVVRVSEILQQYGLDGRALELEVTESILMENGSDTRSKLEELKRLGLRLSIDDFGTGYSSLSYLKTYPFDILKIDRSFVDGLPGSTDSAAIARGIIDIGHGLGMSVLAEGVEHQQQLDFLTAHGCDMVQGYLLGHPMPMADAQAHLTPIENIEDHSVGDEEEAHTEENDLQQPGAI